jgi:hypothetical protein
MIGFGTPPRHQKGTSMVHLRHLVRSAPASAAARLAKALSPEDALAFEATQTMTWISVDTWARIAAVAAPLVFPDEPDPLHALGRDNARHDLNGVYKILVRMMTVPFVVEQSAKLWRTYHSSGEGQCYRIGERELHFDVIGYPDLPEVIRVSTSGYCEGTIAMTGAKGVRVTHIVDDPQRWRWHIFW